MIPVDSLLYKIDQRLNKLSTNDHQQIQLEDKILALNEAQIKLIKQKVDGFSVVSGLGLDAFKKRYEDLQSLVVSYNNQPLTPFLRYKHAALDDTLPPQQGQNVSLLPDTADFKNENQRDRRVFDCVVEEAGPGGVCPAPVK